AGRVDVELDVLVRIFALQKQELRDHDIGDIVVHLTAEEHDAILEQAAEDVPRALAAVGGFDDVWVNDVAPRRFVGQPLGVSFEHVEGPRSGLWSLGHAFSSGITSLPLSWPWLR